MSACPGVWSSFLTIYISLGDLILSLKWSCLHNYNPSTDLSSLSQTYPAAHFREPLGIYPISTYNSIFKIKLILISEACCAVCIPCLCKWHHPCNPSENPDVNLDLFLFITTPITNNLLKILNSITLTVLFILKHIQAMSFHLLTLQYEIFI